MQTTTITKNAKKAKRKAEAGFNTLESGLTDAIEHTEGAVFPSGFSLRRYARQHPVRIGITIGAVGLLAVGLLTPRLRGR